tara:strand:+ start:354 stop:1052 length:699 start_codon:yes stop_codon:yes gene_type:complete
MAKGKKSFVLYTDSMPMIEKLVDKDRINGTNNTGELFYHIFKYVCDEDPEPVNDTIDLLFEHFKQHLKRDLIKYENNIQAKSNAGSLGNLKRWCIDLYKQVESGELTLEKALVIAESRKTSHSDNPVANVAVSVSDSDSVIDSESEIKIINNTRFSLEAKNSKQWTETICIKHSVKEETVFLFIEKFEEHLIAMQEQKEDSGSFKKHFVNWLAKQDLSMFSKPKRLAKTNQI